jgi:hypothetical protein
VQFLRAGYYVAVRIVAIPLLLVYASLPAWGQDTSEIFLPGPPPLALPDWLAPFPQASNQSAKATYKEATSAYTTPVLPAAVISHYEQQMRTAGVSFQTKRDGTGPAEVRRRGGVFEVAGAPSHIPMRRSRSTNRASVRRGSKTGSTFRYTKPVERSLKAARRRSMAWSFWPRARWILAGPSGWT